MTDRMAPALGRAAFDRPNVAEYRSGLRLTLAGQNVNKVSALRPVGPSRALSHPFPTSDSVSQQSPRTVTHGHLLASGVASR